MTKTAKLYLKARAKEWSSRIGSVLAILPALVPLTPSQSVSVVIIAVVLFGVPEDRFKK